MDRNTAQEEQRRAAEAEVEARALKLGKLWESIPEQLHGTPQACLMVARLATSWSHPVPPELAERWYQEWEEFVRAEVPEVTAAAAGLWVPGMAS